MSISLGITLLAGVYETIGFQQNLLSRPADNLQRMMMPGEKGHLLGKLIRVPRLPQESLRKNLSFRLLACAPGAAVVFPAEGAGDIMQNSGGLPIGLRLCIQPFRFPHRLCKGIGLEKMANISKIPAGLGDQYDFGNGHFPLLRIF